jgi:hypothetical protein
MLNPIHSFSGERAHPHELVKAVEQGQVVFCPQQPFQVLQNEAALLTPDLLDGSHKNISYHPTTQAISGARPETIGALRPLLKRYHFEATSWVTQFFPHYVPHLEVGRTSFRPAQIEGRTSSKRKDDTRLHVDAFPSSPVQNKRIFRVFTNIDPAGSPRIWHLGEPFEQVLQHFQSRLKPYHPLLAHVMKHLRITKSHRSAYDHYMLQLHDLMKQDDAYQLRVAKTLMHFPVNSSWFVFTDHVSHAALKGQFVLEQTFYLPVERMEQPDLSPWVQIHRCMKAG